jgi:apolipoprotein N-acyltransferase
MPLALGLSSGLLLVLALPPVSLPFVSFFAFSPLVWLAASRSRTKKDIFLAGCVAGAMGIGFISRAIFGDFAWPADAPLVLEFIHWSFIVWAIALGCAGGAGLLAYRWLRTPFPFLNAALFAGMYIALESALQFITGHYYLGALAYTVTFLRAPFALAPLGGELLVSFVVAFISALLGEIAALKRKERTRALLWAGAACIGAAAICLADAYYLYPSGALAQEIRVAAIQAGSRNAFVYANDYGGALSFPALAETVNDIARSGSDLIIYPSAVVNDVVYTGAPPAVGYEGLRFLPRAVFESWMADNMPASSTVVTWDIAYSAGAYQQDYNFWSGGALSGIYSKRRPYAFTEYTPSFAHFGFGPTPAPITAGTGTGLTTLANGLIVENLQCSEIHLASMARQTSPQAQLLLAIGLEWILPADLGENYSLEATRYRAAENNLPAVRATLEGPSALIDPRGAVVERLGFDQEGVLRGTLRVPLSHRPTLYALAGDYPLLVALAILYAAALLQKRSRAISPDTEE